MPMRSIPEGRVNTNQAQFNRMGLIIDAAATRFRDQGYAATKLSEIAEDVGILKGSLYHYIDTKEDLLFAIIDRNHERIINGNYLWRDLRDDPMAALESFVREHIRNYLANRVDSEVYIRDFRALGGPRKDKILAAQAQYDGDFRDLVESAHAAGLLRPDVTPGYASRAVFGIANWMLFWYDADGSDSVDTVLGRLTRYALASLT